MHGRIHHRRLTNRRRLHGLPALWQRCCFAVEEYAEELQFRLTPKPRNRRIAEKQLNTLTDWRHDLSPLAAHMDSLKRYLARRD